MHQYLRSVFRSALRSRPSCRTTVAHLHSLKSPFCATDAPPLLAISSRRTFATVMTRVERLADDLEKPDLDDRSYRTIRLPNKLEALLVHDAETDKASASLNVNVGNFSDADDMPGMAHAVEHLLFMGTEKYPVENEYSSYLSSNSGHSNAYTAATQTNYFFECAASHEQVNKTLDTGPGVNGVLNGVTAEDGVRGPFYGALDRFAQFFVKPLFLENTLDRELRAVDSENKKNLQSDVWRLSQLQKSLSNPLHPYHHFSTGNLQTLRDEPQRRGVKIRDEFINFYRKHYSANRMKLVVLGREPLDELESWVAELFSEVENKDLPENRWDDVQPFTKTDMLTQVFAKPVMEMRTLELWFPFPDEEHLYETQPSRFISHLMGHEGPGSILSYIKEKGWANSLSAGAYSVCPGSAFFEMEIRLTPDGLEHYQEIVEIVFQYIALMRESPPLEWMHEEMKSIADVEFKFKQKSPASRFTSKISSVMQKPLPREWLLSGTSKLRRFDARGIVQALQYLRDDNFRLTIVSQDGPGDWNQQEKWYGTEYRVEKIPTDFQSQIRKALASSAAERPKGLFLPHRNEFIPTRLEVEKKEVKEPAKVPKLIRNDSTARLWWKKDDTFWAPKANIHITLRNPLTYATPANYVKSAFFCKLVQDSLSEYAYDAEIAGLSYEMSATMLGIDISINGYNDKMPVLLEKVLTGMKDLEVSTDRFKVIKERMMRGYKNWGFQQPYYQVGDFTRWLVNEKSWITPQYATELPHIEAADVKSFFPQLIAQSHVEMLAHGNLYKEEVKKMGDMVESILKPRALPQAQWMLRRNVILPPGSNFVYERTLVDPANINHAIEYYLHVCGVQDEANRAKLQLLAQMTDEPAFDQLRTKEQLGYVVWSGIRPAATTMGYRVIIQSERRPEYLESRIDAFLLKFQEDLAAMSNETFEGHKRSLIAKRQEKVKNLESETHGIWGYINSEYFNFHQVESDVSHIRPLTKEDIEIFFCRYIDPHSSTRAKMSIHMIAQGSPPPDTTKPGTEEESHQAVEPSHAKTVNGINSRPKPVVIEDVHAWKASLQASQGPRPVTDITEFEDFEPKL